MKDARKEIAALHQPAGAAGANGRAKHIVNEHVRDSYDAAIRTAGFVTLLAIPFSLTMRRRPGEAAAREIATAAAAAG